MGVKKKRPLAVLRDRGGNGRCPLLFIDHRLRIPHVSRLCSPGVPDNANSSGLCCARKHLTKGGYRYVVYNIDTP